MRLAPTCSKGRASCSRSGNGIFCASGPEEMKLGFELSGRNSGHGIDDAQHGADNGGGEELHDEEDLEVGLCWLAGVKSASETGGHQTDRGSNLYNGILYDSAA